MPALHPPALELYRTGEPRGFLWVKAVTGVQLTQHCTGALVGEYVPGVDRLTDAQHVPLPPAPAWYLCGVTAPFRYSGNDHLLLLPDPAAGPVEVLTPGYSVVVTGARPQPFGRADIPRGAPLSPLVGYASCRCWQAAWWLRRNTFRHTTNARPATRSGTP